MFFKRKYRVKIKDLREIQKARDLDSSLVHPSDWILNNRGEEFLVTKNVSGPHNRHVYICCDLNRSFYVEFAEIIK